MANLGLWKRLTSIGGNLRAAAPPWLGGAAKTLALVSLLTIAFHSEFVRRQVPWLLASQMKAYNAVTSLRAHPMEVEHVTPVEIGDDAYFTPPLAGRVPTNRAYLADLARRAADDGATVVAVDFQLTPTDGWRDDPTYSKENKYFVDTITAVARATPIVLALSLAHKNTGEWHQLPTIFGPGFYAPGVTFGHINMPRNVQQLPLYMWARVQGETELRPVPSFAQAIAHAWDEATSQAQLKDQSRAISEASNAREFVFGEFLPRERYAANTISSGRLLSGMVKASKHRIALIGAAWHRPPGSTIIVDAKSSPIGVMPGMYMHANYVESLLSGHFQQEVSVPLALIVDMIIGLLLYWAYHNHHGWRVAITLVLPVVLAYVFVINLDLYLDAAFPLVLCGIHLAIEHFL